MNEMHVEVIEAIRLRPGDLFKDTSLRVTDIELTDGENFDVIVTGHYVDMFSLFVRDDEVNVMIAIPPDHKVRVYRDVPWQD